MEDIPIAQVFPFWVNVYFYCTRFHSLCIRPGESAKEYQGIFHFYQEQSQKLEPQIMSCGLHRAYKLYWQGNGSICCLCFMYFVGLFQSLLPMKNMQLWWFFCGAQHLAFGH